MRNLSGARETGAVFQTFGRTDPFIRHPSEHSHIGGMKKDSDVRTVEFNPPAVIRVRLVFLLWVLTLAATFLLIMVGGLTHNVRSLILGGVAGLTALALFHWLRRHVRLLDLFDSINAIGQMPSPERDFVQLVDSWEDLQARRGTADFDAWELLRLRREIEARAKTDPQLADYWHDHRT